MDTTREVDDGDAGLALTFGLGIIARTAFNGDRRIRIVPFRDGRSEMVEALLRLADGPPRPRSA